MAIYLNGTLIGQSNKVFFIVIQISSTGKVYGNGTQVWTGGTLTLMAQVFNASGTFTMPSGVVNDQVIVACTGGGGGGFYDAAESTYTQGGGGSGRTVTTVALSAGATATISVGAGGNRDSLSNGGTSSFGAYLSCGGGGSGYNTGGVGVSGGGNGGSDYNAGTASSCGAILSLQAGAVDSTGDLYAAKSFAAGGLKGGGSGCYSKGSSLSAGGANTGTGGGGFYVGGSGKVVVFYYKYV